jgi:hypothetical protein
MGSFGECFAWELWGWRVASDWNGCSAAINFPCAYLVKGRMPRQSGKSTVPIVDWYVYFFANKAKIANSFVNREMFKDPRFPLILTGSSLALWPLFVPPLFVPPLPRTVFSHFPT